MVVTTKDLTRLSDAIGAKSTPSRGTTCMGLQSQERQDASLILPTSGEPLNPTPSVAGTHQSAIPEELSPVHIVEGKLDSMGEAVISRVPLVSANGQPLMPCRPTKAKKLIDRGLAIKQWSKLGILRIRLKFNPNPSKQQLALGIDTGSKFEGYSVVGTQDTVLNIMSEATTWVSKAVEQRRIMRRARRRRNTRRRECRFNNRLADQGRITPSTKARWDTKLRVINQLKAMLPISTIVVEDIAAVAKKGKRRWNGSFSPLEAGKRYFYSSTNLVTHSGMETAMFREQHCLTKLPNKAKRVFESHCVDAWALAASETGAQQPTTIALYHIVPLRWHRRQLHRLQPKNNGRKPYGGTLSLGIKRGSLIKHRKYGFFCVGGYMHKVISLHNMDGIRLAQNCKIEGVKVLTKISFRTKSLSQLKGVSFGAVL